MECRVCGLYTKVLEFRVLGFRASGLEFRVSDVRF